MSSILELAEARALAARWSVDDYEQYGEMLAEQGVLPKSSVLIRGIIIEKTSKTPLHVEILTWLRDELRRLLSTDYTLYQEGPLRLIDSEPEPGIAVVRGTRAETRGKHPTSARLVVEVAVTTVSMDREYAFMYAEANVDEYWIILAQTHQIEVRRQPLDGVYQETVTDQRGDTLRCESLPDVIIILDELFG